MISDKKIRYFSGPAGLFFKSKRLIVRGLVAGSLIFGIQRVCCLGLLEAYEDYTKYHSYSSDEFSILYTNNDLDFINSVRQAAKPGDGVLVPGGEEYFLSYYLYPIKLYKFKKGYYDTSKSYDVKDVGQEWLDRRGIKWVLIYDDNDIRHFKRLDELRP